MFEQEGRSGMPKAKYDHIYKDLKEKIETEFYAYQQMLPSENAFVKEYGCSRNTVRRALAELTAEEKNAISHRGNALNKFKTELENYLNGTDQ